MATPERAALVAGGSNGIGFAIASLLGELGYGLTILSRRPALIDGAADSLRTRGFEVQALAADVREEDAVIAAVRAHEERFGRLDVLVNNAGLGIGGAVGETRTEHLDLQLGVDLRAVILFTREALPMLTAAGEEHGGALVLNTASITGKAGHEWLSVYSAAKHGVVGYTQALNRELNRRGVKACALCPGYVDTDLTEYLRDELPAEEMISTADIVAMVRGLLELSRWCVDPEIVFQRPGDPVVSLTDRAVNDRFASCGGREMARRRRRQVRGGRARAAARTGDGRSRRRLLPDPRLRRR